MIGTLVLGAVFTELEDLWTEKRASGAIAAAPQAADQRLHWADIRRILPFIGRSAVIGTVIGALPGIGSTLAATLGYTLNRRRRAPRS